MTDTREIKRALISVYDKTGLDELARGLHEAGVAIVSTGSTAARIAELGIPVTEVKDVTGFPESLDGRVKTLHPKIHGGLLADIRKPDHVQQLDDLGIEAFDGDRESNQHGNRPNDAANQLPPNRNCRAK